MLHDRVLRPAEVGVTEGGPTTTEALANFITISAAYSDMKNNWKYVKKTAIKATISFWNPLISTKNLTM